MKIILTEKQLSLVHSKLINEIGLDGSGDQYIAGGNRTQTFKNAINTKKSQKNDKLVKAPFPKTEKEIKDFQKFARNKGFLNVSGTKKGQLISADGKWGPNSESAWKKLSSNYYVPKTDSSKNNNLKIKTGNTSWVKSTSKQVKKQIWYLMNEGFDRPFTVLDDINSKVYAVNSDYSLYGVYNVITGKDRGDELKDVTFGDWYMENPLDNTWQFLKDVFKSKKEGVGNKIRDAVSHLDGQYFGTKMWVKKNTPSGIFKTDKSPGNWLESKVMTSFAEKDYGKRFIGFNTLSGKPIAVGFHGTKNPARINIGKDDWTQAVKRRGGNFSFGCVNFKDADIQKITNFITDGQYSFWLPDTSSNIVKFNSGEKPSILKDLTKQVIASNAGILGLF